MPKDRLDTSTISTAKSNSGPILRRNQVIGGLSSMQKTKVEMVPGIASVNTGPFTNDARRPCSTCVRSHSHALAHAQQGSPLPPLPDCTYDDVPDVDASGTSPESSKHRSELLESRILELEALLKEKQEMIASLTSSSVGRPQHLISSNPNALSSPPSTEYFDSLGAVNYVDSSILDNTLSAFGMFKEPSATELDILWPKWPRSLPRPDLFRHTVDAFFAFHPHATRLFNMSAFLTSLSLPSDHPDFPSLPVLHAVCAVGSLYTVANRRHLGSNDSDFAEQQVLHAKSQIDKHLMSGQKPLECLQATIILSWYYWSHARWFELFVSTGQSLRIAVPLGLNLCPPFHALNATTKSMSIMPTPTFMEDELRRNVFWLAYAIDRQYGAGNGWAMSLDDSDVAQFLPLPGAILDAGISLSAEHRQWSHLSESFLVHPPDLTDSFTLYIKVMMVISRIKSFNHRFRIKENLGDPESKTTRLNRLHEPDIRSATTFSQLDDLIVSFRSSLPHEFSDPFINNCIDPHLHVHPEQTQISSSTILLHEPHSNVKTRICTSAMKILHAARGILELVYVVLSTNYDLGLLDPFCAFCWFLAGRVFGRFLKAAQGAKSAQQIETLQLELEFIRTALSKMGERVPLSARYQKMLDASISEACEPPSVTVTVPVNGVPVRTMADDFLLSRVTETQISAYDLGTYMRLYNGLVQDS